MARNHWLVGSLLFLFIFPMVTTPATILPNAHPSTAFSYTIPNPPPPYGPTAPVGQYTGSGDPTDIDAHYNKSLSTKTQTTDEIDFTIDVPPDWSSSFSILFQEITIDGVLLDVETNETGSEGSDQLPCAMSFQVTNSCYLNSVMLKMFASVGDLRDGNDLFIEIYNASNDGGKPKPEAFPVSTSIFQDLGGLSASFDGWKNITWVGGVFLDTAATYNNYFFVVATPVSPAFPYWKWRLDSETGNDGYAWRGSTWTEHVGIDFFLNVSLAPMDYSPAPSQISMQVNSTSVIDGGANDGSWSSTFTSGTKTVLFNVFASWPTTFNYTYLAEFTRNFIGATAFLADYQLVLTNWNITTSIIYPNINADANSRTLNFSLPAYWNVQALLNGSTLIPGSNYQVQDNSPTPGWLYIDELGGAGNGTLWRIISTDSNYLQIPMIWHGSSDVTGQEVNITDTLFVTAQVISPFIDGEGRFNPYDESGTSLNEWRQFPDGTGLLTFPSFSPNSYLISNETMRCEVVWNNSYHVGIGLASVYLVYPTSLTDVLGPYTSLIGDNVNIRVYYEDTHNSMGIENAEVNVTFGGTTYSLSDDSGGYYESALDTLAMSLGRGVHSGIVCADRSGYDVATTTVSLTLWSKTRLDANWTTHIISYTETVTLEVNYSVWTPLGEGGIEDAQVNITRQGPAFFTDLVQLGGGNYSVVLDGTVLDVGTHIFVINASKPGFFLQPNTLVITLTVLGEPTTITGSHPSPVNGGEAFNVTVTYRKFSDGSGITGAGYSCLLNGTPITPSRDFDFTNGTYMLEFRLNVTGSTSTFNITITISRGGFDPQTYEALIEVQIQSAIVDVVVLSSLPLIYDNAFTLLVTYTDSGAQGLVGAVVEGNWTIINTIDHLDGTYTVQCVTTGASVGYWWISFNISVENYEYKYFTESFHLVWPTSLIPENGDYTPSEYENETLLLDVTFTNTELGSGITAATVWAVFQTTSYPLVPVGGGVYQLTLDLTGITPSTYSVVIYAQRTHHENQTITLNLAVLAKLNPVLTVYIPPNIRPAQEIPITLQLTFPNGTAIVGVPIDVVVWMHHANGTDVTLLTDTVTTDTLGMRILIVLIPTYPNELWGDGNNAPQVWANATYLGSRELAYTTVSTFSALIPPSPLPWWVELLLALLPFIVILVIIAIIGRVVYVKRVRPKKLAKQMKVEQAGGVWAQRMMGLMDLRTLFVMYAKTGLPIFTYNFTGGELLSALLSGFISAVNSFYSELSGGLDRESQLRDIHYKDLHLSLREGKYIVSVLILDESPSEEVTESLGQFTTRFEAKFDSELAKFDGRIDIFEPAQRIVEASFHSELLLSYECVHAPSRGFARKVYKLAVKLANTEGHILLPTLFIAAVKKFGPDKKFAVANALEQLNEEGCLVPAEEGSPALPIQDDEATNTTSEG